VRLQVLLASHQRLRGIDNALGLNLPRLLRHVGLVEPEMLFIHSSGLSSGRRQAPLGYSFFEASPHFVGSGLTSDAELKQLSALAADETISVAQARMPAAWARKGTRSI
jgi:hypothetical protein